MINMREHIATIVAIFLALTVGILMGTVVGERGEIEKRQAELVKSVRDEFRKIRAQNADLSRAIERNTEFQEKAVPILLDDRLRGKKVLLIVGKEGTPAYAQDLTETLKEAKASLCTLRVRKERLGLDDPSVRARVSEVLRSSGQGEEVLDETVRELARELSKSGGTRLLSALVKTGAVSLDNPDSLPADVALVVSSSEDGQDNGSLPVILAGALMKEGTPVVAVASSADDPGVLEPFSSLGASTVDNANTPVGRLSTVLVSAGAEGSFGYGPQAKALMPPLE